MVVEVIPNPDLRTVLVLVRVPVVMETRVTTVLIAAAAVTVMVAPAPIVNVVGEGTDVRTTTGCSYTVAPISISTTQSGFRTVTAGRNC